MLLEIFDSSVGGPGVRVRIRPEADSQAPTVEPDANGEAIGVGYSPIDPEITARPGTVPVEVGLPCLESAASSFGHSVVKCGADMSCHCNQCSRVRSEERRV